MHVFHYIGNPALIERNAFRLQVRSEGDLAKWYFRHQFECDCEGLVPATYIVDAAGWLWIAERRSEHVCCAHGEAVQAAGELFIETKKGVGIVARMSNQSTGYCPAVESWNVIHDVLDKLEVSHPLFFDPQCEFRQCESCGIVQLVKDDFYECCVCSNSLPETRNIANVVAVDT